MGIGITREHRELAEAVRGWVARVASPQDVRKILDGEDGGGGRPPYWDGAAAMGLLDVHLPEGGGGSLLDLAVVLEETGRAALPGPFLPSVLAADLLVRGGKGGLAAGHPVAAAATAPGSLTAVAVDGGYLLDGTAPPVLGAAPGIDLVLLAAEAAHGTVWLAVDAGDLEIRTHTSADPTRPTGEVVARNTLVPGDRQLGLTTALVSDLAAILYAADACGTAGWALDTATAYAKVREQFGRPIGQFQAVKHLCADMLVRVEQARALVWDAANAVDEAPDVRGLAAALAAATALDAAFSCAKDCIQILGGIGFTWEHDAHLHLRRALVARQLLGAGDGHRLRAVRLAAAGARRELRMELPAEAETYRRQAREVVEQARGLDPGAARRALAPTGYAAPHLPVPYGLGAGPVQQLAVQRELKEAGVALSALGISTWVVPSLIAYGADEQKERFVLPTLRGELMWCQLFSEPDAGSDLASLRTRAERTEDGRWRISGQKVWTSAAQWADYGILLARTDPDAPTKHQGLGYFVVDMKNTDGIDIRPLKEITGDSLFNEVYFDDAVLPANALVGEETGGWKVARNTLGNERVHMADQVAFDTGLEALITRAADLDGATRARVGALAAEAHALACIGLRTTLQQVDGLEAGAGASVRKLVQTPHQQKITELALELLGPEGALREGAGERAVHGFLMSRCLTIAGGTTQVQLNVVAERILGLPRD
ncbi:putative acyl-CoA dehydrogenase FadE [Streptomyces spiroverticillatus]|uniref:Acyl-CoA dehydrogenase FadE n=1 Tax=Streptomyces finlayi TaxID=67296 RepID=A0A918X2W3_9ACTN|nr:acyl-CoA dehydrogenase [Streptomyces finlayi]GGZ94552.1 putative acyl-CoA dehydrogenase FadE [Streptomyces spiroverticillatus]GHD06942.1 putative acyl-CoA dehydrogenase FadE [Streptomyces finlayi]